MPAAAVTPPRGEGRPPPLAVPAILRWCDAHRRRTGCWPRRDDGPVGGGPPGLTWLQVDAALRYGLRGLPGGSSLPRLLAAHRGHRHRQALPPLTEAAILRWAEEHHRRTGRWPSCRSGPVPGAPGESWPSINSALWQGHRGLPGGDSLARLLARRQGVPPRADRR